MLHYDPPEQAKDYVHRSGRTARAGAGGTVVSLVTDKQRRGVARMIRRLDIASPIASPRPEVLAEIAERVPAQKEILKKQVERDLPAVPPHRRNEQKSHAGNGRRPAKGRQKGRKADSIYVANLPWSATDADLRALFKRYGKVHGATVITDRKSGRSKGFGFVDMHVSAGRVAVRELNGKRMRGRDLTVRFAQPRRAAG